ncbi:hypothetical protein UFOVP73_18 [uncultured Caudovirales phage]|uniref:Uncharacterized protein n=1 Tax=uncultured Caudovirales phage TaxID=2100421 RepID=A0A6J7WF95_9CAUD|nr:hypothetical protein UFOVP73_18 [uncultured Caudovirales phage]CAB5195017.1 hypothetical protein UFOVP170_40 [uncultured Caudovirales phage]
MTDHIHSCSYYCTRFACAVRQRDDMRELLISLAALLSSFGCEPIQPLPLMGADSEGGEP